MAETQEVDIPALAATGKATGESADVLDAVTDAQLPLLAGSGFAGWGFGAQLRSGAETWSAYLKNLRGELRGFGTSLTQSAIDYQEADENAAATVRRPLYGPWAE